MAKKSNKYKLRLEQVELLRPDDKTYEPLEIEFGNHDNIFDSSDKIALITGASSGMGKVIVEALT